MHMGELQFQLLRADVIGATKATRSAIVLAAVAASLLVAAAPLLLLALAVWLEHQYELSQPMSLVIAGSAAVVISVVLLVSAWSVGKSGVATLSRSMDELQKNLECVKQSLAGGNDTDRRE